MSEFNLSWGLPIMDRLNEVHRASRVTLPTSVVLQESDGAFGLPSARLRLLVSRYLGMVGFVTAGIVVIATASMLALSVQ